MRGRASVVTVLAVAALSSATITGCSKSTTDSAKKAAKSAATDVQRAGEQAGARAAAEALRVAIRRQADDRHEPVRSIAVLQAAVKDLPGSPTVLGIADANHDGADDDGKVEVKVGDQYACVSLPASGTNIDVNGGRC